MKQFSDPPKRIVFEMVGGSDRSEGPPGPQGLQYDVQNPPEVLEMSVHPKKIFRLRLIYHEVFLQLPSSPITICSSSSGISASSSSSRPNGL